MFWWKKQSSQRGFFAVRRGLCAGVAVVSTGSMMDGGMRFAYLDGAHAGVPYVELAYLGPEMKAFYEAIKAG